MARESKRFEDLKLTRQFLNAVEDLGYTTPTPVQEKAIPLLKSGVDVIGIAQTGTGKTAAFVIPILQKLNYAQGKAPRALILSPTKELVLQTCKAATELAKYTDLRVVALYGGIGPKSQIAALEEGCDVLVSTPGRFLEIYQKNALSPNSIKTVVLDEADRLMDMGFMRQIRAVQELVPSKRQNLLFSATYPPRVESLGEEFLDFPVRIEVTPQATSADTIDQYAYLTKNFMTKINLLEHFMAKEEFSKVIIFANGKKTADNISKFASRKIEGESRVIHSNKGQNARINSINAFSSGEVRILVTTDVSARGIDIDQVSHVINFEFPYKYEDYVHRIGRTGRAYNVGTAISFLNTAEKMHLKYVEDLIQKKIPIAEFPEEVEVPYTEKEERIEIERQIDIVKRRENPEYKGAFHEKKARPTSNKKPFKKKKRR